MKQFCITHRRALMALSLVSGAFAVCMVVTGCAAPAWLTDAESLIPILGASITSVLSFIAAMTGNAGLSSVLNAISTVITDVGNGLTELQSLITQYKSNPSETTLQKIEDVANLISTNLNQILTATGLPAAVASKIQSWAQLVLTQLEAWLAVLPSLKVAAAAKSERVLMSIPAPANDKIMSAAALKGAINEIWTTPTGDPTVDAALVKVKLVQ